MLSPYAAALPASAKARYLKKVELMGVGDPFLMDLKNLTPVLTKNGDFASNLPDIGYPDIFNYLINSTSPYTFQQLKSYKSLDSYKYFLAGWVQDVSFVENKENNLFVILSKVKMTILGLSLSIMLFIVINYSCI